jgi:hypothetical protein
MTAEQKIKREILLIAGKNEEYAYLAEGITEGNVDERYTTLDELDDTIHELENDFRCCGMATGINCEYSRHYESKGVAAKLSDGSWVGWTYWYGGGKHGEPESVEWMEYAYDLEVTETEKMVVVREFKKVGA